MEKVNYYSSFILLVILCLIDGFLILMLLGAISSGVAAVIICLIFLSTFLYLTVRCYKWHKKYALQKGPKFKMQKEEKSDSCDEPLWVSSDDGLPVKTVPQKESGLKPNYEIVYKDADGDFSRRQISVISFDGKVIEAFCFLRNEKRTFYVPRITECVDISTGEVVDGDLRVYFASMFKIDPKPCNIYRYDEWSKIVYSKLPELPEDLHDFELDEKLNLGIVTFNDGKRNESFYCGKIFKSSYDVDQFYIQLVDSAGESLSVGFSKIFSVDGAESFSSYVLQKFYQSDKGRASKLIADYRIPLSILVYLGRSDSSLNSTKRQFICEYMQFIGADCSDEVLSKASRKVKVELPEFKKLVNAYAKFVDDGQKERFLSAAESVVGGRAKAKPFGLAGLQYIESKIKI